MSDLPIVLRPAWRTHWVLMLFAILMVGVAAFATVSDGYVVSQTPLVFWAVAAISGIVIVYHRFLWRFEVDGTRLKAHKGIVGRNQQSVRLKDLRSIELRQTIFQRLFNVGAIAFYTSGSDEAEITFEGISAPMDVRDRIKEIMDADI